MSRIAVISTVNGGLFVFKGLVEFGLVKVKTESIAWKSTGSEYEGLGCN